MKDSHENDDNVFLITFSDLLNIIKKNKHKIKLWAIVFASVAVLYGLIKPAEYEAKGTFKEKGKNFPRAGNSLAATFMVISDGQQDSDALTMMRSRKLIEEIIKTQGLQGVIAKNESRFPLPLKEIKNNLLIEYALLRKTPFPVLADSNDELKLQQITYEHEIPLKMRVRTLKDDHYAVFDGKNRLIDNGTFGTPFASDTFSFTLTCMDPSNLKNNDYTLTLLPMGHVAEQLSKQFVVETDRDDKTLIVIKHRNRDRWQAAANVNTLMQAYLDHIKLEHEMLANIQFEYLSARQLEMRLQLEAMMEANAKDLSTDISTTGFATSAKAMEFLATNQQLLKQKLFTVDLEIQRLEDMEKGKAVDGDLFFSTQDLDVINKITAEKRTLKQQADSLSLALRSSENTSPADQNSFFTQFKDLDEVKNCIKDSTAMLAELTHYSLPNPYPRMVENPKFIVKAWYERFAAAKENLDKTPSSKDALEHWQHCKDGFSLYLSNLNHYLRVYQRNIEERLAHQQIPTAEFQGINLNIARDLYISYSKEHNDLESEANQNEFIISQIDEPSFEVSSLSMNFTDPVSVDMISKTSALVLSLKDYENRSTKEKERILADLAIQKTFLKNHIQQSVSLLKLRQKFLKEKIKKLQTVNLSLIQEQISILENQLKDYLSSALENLKREQGLIEQNLVDLRIEMAAIPQKWSTEQLIDHQMEINKALMEEISKLVESTNISNNLEKYQSSPVDHSLVPLHPKSPHLLLLALVGAATGALLSFIWMLGWSAISGIEASLDTIETAGLHVSGKLTRRVKKSRDNSPLLDSDLNTLRRLLSFTTQKSKETGNSLLLIEGPAFDYAPALADLFALRGVKVLLMDLRFDEPANSTSTGMVHYLEGKVSSPEIISSEKYDYISSGGLCRHANELISSPRFKNLLELLSKRYDWIVAASSASPNSSETESLLELFPCAAVTIHNETMPQLKVCFQHAKALNTRITFIKTDEEI